MLNFVIWGAQDVDFATRLEAIQGVENEWELNEGVSRVVSFPDNAHFRMDSETPDNTIVPDNVKNADYIIVASSRIANFLRDLSTEAVEYLPCHILDHKGKRLSAPYYIVHPIDPIQALDPQACGATWDRLDPEFVKRVRRLAFFDRWIDKSSGNLLIDRKIFRDRRFTRVTFIHRDLASALAAAGFTGLRWIEIEDFPQPGAGRA